jgi:large subunit ribosomal protein L15
MGQETYHIQVAYEMHRFSVEMSKLNLDQIQLWINKGRLDPNQPITIRELCSNHCLNGVQDGVKLLARGKEQLVTPVHIVVSRASEEAIKAIEDLGGSVTTRYYTKFAVDKIRRGKMHPLESIQSRIPLEVKQANTPYPFRLPDPTSRKDLEYYRDSAKRGYLSYTVAEGHGPSLYFKAPGTVQKNLTAVSAKQRQQQKEASRLW